jgi:hypothetical protein
MVGGYGRCRLSPVSAICAPPREWSAVDRSRCEMSAAGQPALPCTDSSSESRQPEPAQFRLPTNDYNRPLPSPSPPHGFAGVRPTPARRQRIAAVSAAQQERIAEQHWPATPLAVSSKIKTHHRLHPSLSQSKISHAPTQQTAPKITPAIIAATPGHALLVFVAAIATADSRDDGMSPSTTR